jgi:hypothetical protein
MSTTLNIYKNQFLPNTKKKKKEEIRNSVHEEHRKFKLSTAIWVIIIFMIFMLLAYMLSQPVTPGEISLEGAKAIENADNNRVFNSLLDSMKKFSR